MFMFGPKMKFFRQTLYVLDIYGVGLTRYFQASRVFSVLGGCYKPALQKIIKEKQKTQMTSHTHTETHTHNKYIYIYT